MAGRPPFSTHRPAAQPDPDQERITQMAGVLLTHSNHLFSDRKQVEKMQPYPPLQTLIAAAVLRNHGVPVSLFDPTLTPPAEFEIIMQRQRPDLVVVCEDDFNYLSKMCLARSRDLAFQMSEWARQQQIPIVAHGSDASDHVDEYIRAGFDAVLIGEVEATLLELVSGAPMSEIAGLAFRSGGSVCRTEPRRLQTNLDALPFPACDLVDIDSYREAWLSAHGYFSLNMVSSRGCPYRCNWCAKPVFGSNYHFRSPERVAREMLQLKSEFRADHVWFADDIFALSPQWTRSFAETVERIGAVLPFKMQSRCDLMTRDT